MSCFVGAGCLVPLQRVDYASFAIWLFIFHLLVFPRVILSTLWHVNGPSRVSEYLLALLAVTLGFKRRLGSFFG